MTTRYDAIGVTTASGGNKTRDILLAKEAVDVNWFV
jgi:hypothetical protein